MKTEKIIITDYKTNMHDGFAHICFNYENETYYYQVCLCERKEYMNEYKRHTLSQDPYYDPYKNEVDCSDCGADWGICGEANEKASKKFGSDFCFTLLKRTLRKKCGTRFI